MRAIWRGEVRRVEDDYGDGLVLDGGERVPYGEPGLVVDPTDGELEDATGVPLPTG